jgi:ribose transport system ATP-binding protein
MMPSINEVALSIESLSKTFGPITVLRGAHLDLVAGQIHGLLGENGSGKSTLIKVLSGYHEPDLGASVRFWGKPVEFPLRAGAARALGLSFVHQDLGLIPELSIVENLFVSEIASGKRTVTRRQMVQATQEILRRYSIDARPEHPVAVLRLGDRALLAIARAFNEVTAAAGNADMRRVLILDEPTAAMSLDENKDLYRTFAALAKAGHALMLVSHDLDEIMEVTDVVTVLRDGEVVGAVQTASAMPDEIIRMIIGHNVSKSGRRRAREIGDIRLETRNINSTVLANLSFAVRSGEVVGAAGLVGSGYAEINQTLFGLEGSAAGQISVGGQQIDLKYHTPSDAVRLGMGLVPIERDKSGVSLELSVTDNLTVQILQPPDGSRRPWLSRVRLKRAAADAVARYRIKAPALTALLKTLSGGNRQKVLLAKWLISGKFVLLLDEPTQAVDVGAHEEILNVVDQFARSGGAVLIASEDWDQLAEICDRVLIFAGGSVKAELKGDELSKHAIGEACYKWGSRLARAGVAQSEATI